jgi:hypothetical protein
MHGVRLRFTCPRLKLPGPALRAGQPRQYRGQLRGLYQRSDQSFEAQQAHRLRSIDGRRGVSAWPFELKKSVRRGNIPLQGCSYLKMDRQFHDKSPVVNQSLFNPDWIYGVMAPKSPAVNKLLIWHLYSGQAYGIFHGDLDFYFGGFDARDPVG